MPRIEGLKIDEAKEYHVSSIDNFADDCANRVKQVADVGRDGFPRMVLKDSAGWRLWAGLAWGIDLVPTEVTLHRLM